MKNAFLVLFLIAAPLAAQVALKKEEGRIAVTIDGKPFTTFYYSGEDVPKPYLHPLLTATGKRITRVYPMENIDGETKDHPHHRGLWFTHGEVNEWDFWANEKVYAAKRKNLGVIDFVKLVKAEGGKQKGEIVSVHLWKAPDGTPLLEENRTMTFYAGGKHRVVDFDVTFTAKTKVKFRDTKEGFFAIRLRDELMERKGGTLVNAEGAKGMRQVWGKPSPWNDYYGTLEGETVGVAILDHPGNYRHPTHWHSRDYGLFAANALGEHDYYNDKTRDAGLTLEPGQSQRWRYRVVIHTGTTEEAGIARLFAEYAKTK
jgi:hypothetical protein